MAFQSSTQGTNAPSYAQQRPNCYQLLFWTTEPGPHSGRLGFIFAGLLSLNYWGDETTVDHLRNTLGKHFGIPPRLLRLYHGHQFYNEKWCLLVCGVRLGSFICAELGTPGGGTDEQKAPVSPSIPETARADQAAHTSAQVKVPTLLNNGSIRQLPVGKISAECGFTTDNTMFPTQKQYLQKIPIQIGDQDHYLTDPTTDANLASIDPNSRR